MATLRKASFVRTTGLLKFFALASLVVTAASCGGSDDSSESRQRNSALSDPVVATYELDVMPSELVLDDDGNAYVIGDSEKVMRVTKDGVVTVFATLPAASLDLDIDENGNIYTLHRTESAAVTESVLTGFTKNGDIDISMAGNFPVDRIAVSSSKVAFASQGQTRSLGQMAL